MKRFLAIFLVVISFNYFLYTAFATNIGFPRMETKENGELLPFEGVWIIVWILEIIWWLWWVMLCIYGTVVWISDRITKHRNKNTKR